MRKLQEGMTRKEVIFQYNLVKYLKEDGFKTFGEYLSKFHLNFLTSEQAGTTFIAAINPEQGIVYVNPNVTFEAISLLIRHEIGHYYFQHRQHMFAKLKELGINTPSQLAHELANYAGDYHISNQIYDDEDKYMAKHIKIKDLNSGEWQTFKGLVTELDFPDHPEYWHMEFDDLWDVFVKDYKPQDLEEKPLSEEFVEGWNAFVDDFANGIITVDDIKDIIDKKKEFNNPFKGQGEKEVGYQTAFNETAAALFGGSESSEEQDKSDERLKPIPIPRKNNSDHQKDKSKIQNQKPEQGQEKGEQGQEKGKSFDDLSEKEKQELLDRIKAARDATQDVIDDAGNDLTKKDSEDQGSESQDSEGNDSNSTSQEGNETDAAKDAEKIDKELSELEKEAKEAKSIEDANKIAARLKSIADFWDEKHIKANNQERKTRIEYQRLAHELRQAKLNAKNRDYSYRPMSINAITNNIIHTIKNQVTSYRDSSWSRYNARSDDLGYIAPGRYTVQKKKKPKVVFYFDVSGSWCGDKLKINMGHRIEEALKKLDQLNKIDLHCFYFGTKVHTEFTEEDQGNSDAPIPHAIELAQAGQLDNVIIMTDDNPHCELKLEVPGYAWLLFYDTVSGSLAANVSGKKGTTIVMIQHD